MRVCPRCKGSCREDYMEYGLIGLPFLLLFGRNACPSCGGTGKVED